VAMSISKA